MQGKGIINTFLFTLSYLRNLSMSWLSPDLFILFIYLIAFTVITMLKKTKEKNTFEQDTKNEGRRCGTHNRARLQIECALTENT